MKVGGWVWAGWRRVSSENFAGGLADFGRFRAGEWIGGPPPKGQGGVIGGFSKEAGGDRKECRVKKCIYGLDSGPVYSWFPAPPPRFGGGLTARPQGTAAPVSGAAGGSRVFPARQLISAAAGKVSCFLNVLLVLQRNFCVNFCQLFYCAKWFVLKIFSPFFPSKIFVNFLKKQFVSHKKHGTIGKGRALGALAERRFPPLRLNRVDNREATLEEADELGGSHRSTSTISLFRPSPR